MRNEALHTPERTIAPAAASNAMPGGCRPLAQATTAPPVADEGFLALLQGFRRHGGLVRLRELLLTRQAVWHPEVLAALPAALAGRQVLGIAWGDAAWVPAFQFDAAGRVRPVVAAVHADLVPVFDPCELAQWWISPSCWLHERRPIDVISSAAARVREAARVDRYVAAGG